MKWDDDWDISWRPSSGSTSTSPGEGPAEGGTTGNIRGGVLRTREILLVRHGGIERGREGCEDEDIKMASCVDVCVHSRCIGDILDRHRQRWPRWEFEGMHVLLDSAVEGQRDFRSVLERRSRQRRRAGAYRAGEGAGPYDGSGGVYSTLSSF
jgi:hypothetical protein